MQVLDFAAILYHRSIARLSKKSEFLSADIAI